jgi:glutaredoxin
MKNSIDPTHQTLRLTSIALGATLLLAASQLQAQTVYRVVGADGRITFSDKAPMTGSTTVSGVNVKSSASSSASLPFELRQVASKYPVTLYSGSNCGPCGEGRSLLTGRGIPFTEKTVTTNEDAEALQRISGDSSLPFLTIGAQQIKGYSDAEWNQFLNAAGYPSSSVLPTGYRNPAAAPLVTLQKQAPAAKSEEKPAQRIPGNPITPPPDNSSNPAGIKF